MKRLLVVLTLAALPLFGVGAAAREGVQESEYVGAAHCAGCHPAEYDAWKASPHARALEGLSATEQKDARCRQCHTTSPDDADPALAGVQCEACHGRGRYYSARWVMKDPELRGALFYERGKADTCKRCHNDMSPSLTPFEFDKKMALIRHGPPVGTPVGPPTPEKPK
ncbi:MAG: cytochrome c family protein [Deltaproteobacteria bacterium]|nr:cytochrome c family protein [Deltaproteobacteria bacterium]